VSDSYGGELHFPVNSCGLQILLPSMSMGCFMFVAKLSGLSFFFVVVGSCLLCVEQAVLGCFFEAKLKKGLG
jgi:hypothetical protein